MYVFRCFNLTEKHVVLTERGFDRLKLLGRHPSPSNLIGALEGKEELELELEREEVVAEVVRVATWHVPL